MLKSKIAKYAAIALAGATLLTGALKGWNDYTSTPQYIANHDFRSTPEKWGIKRILRETTDRNLERVESSRDLEEILSRVNFKKENIEKIELVKSTETSYISPETNPQITKRIKIFGKDSIYHLFTFINSPYLKKQELQISAPQTANEIKTEQTEKINAYVVKSLGSVTLTLYRMNLKDGRSGVVSSKHEVACSGLNNMKVVITPTEKGYTAEKSPNPDPIFYSTTGERISKVDALSIETLHGALREYTIKNIGKEIENIGRNDQEVMKAINKWRDREETITHGICMLWVQQYNQDRQLKMSQKEMDDRFKLHNHINAYRHVNRFSPIVQQIGPAKAVELYATNPEGLFREIEKK
ncbi:MAG: hypothetical protein WCI72_04105 [archaeon]